MFKLINSLKTRVGTQKNIMILIVEIVLHSWKTLYVTFSQPRVLHSVFHELARKKMNYLEIYIYIYMYFF